ncbi:uncharacterized protein BCR38DRAFT_324148, partial [Pseudomassariella vexata]
VAEYVRRDDGVGPCGVPQYNYDMCQDQLVGVTVNSTIPVFGQAQFDYLPPACMDLAGFIVGSCNAPDGPIPVPCGSACMLYMDMTSDHYTKLALAL